MSRRASPFAKHSSHVHIDGESHGPRFDPNDWQNGITVPRPRVWEPRPDLIGKTVVLHRCYISSSHERTGNYCACDLIGTPVTITAIDKAYSSYTYAAYRIEGSTKRITEHQFSDETRDMDADEIAGYILEGPDGRFLAAGFAWVPEQHPLHGYLHNTGVVRDLVHADFPNGRPTKAYPARSKLDGSAKRIVGDPVPFDTLAL
ncbi:hypothetical protein HY480_01545 [Candidatus Uhrbacteria bacterium]|nr:hypothetical protein [Candidatus Uhrbacteria bacterium]